MNEIAALIAQGKGWFFFPTAILLGALHGLEPGHSKTMMAAFIVAVRGTVAQAVLLALSATLSHTAVVWATAFIGLTYGQAWLRDGGEPYFKIASGAIILGVALWMVLRTRQAQLPQPADNHRHSHDHIHADHGHSHTAEHAHNHNHEHEHLLASHSACCGDAHERAHAEDLRRRLAKGPVGTGQIVLFGLTGGLLPCPAAITVLLVCLQLKEVSLGLGLVLGFSIGLALTLVTTGIIAAWGAHHARKRWPIFDAIAARAPYLSGGFISLLGLYIAWQGYAELAAR